MIGRHQQTSTMEPLTTRPYGSDPDQGATLVRASSRHGESTPDARATASSRVTRSMQVDAPRVANWAWANEVVGGDLRVPLLDGTQRRYVNVDNAASTPPLVAVWDAVERFVLWYSSVHRGSGFKSQVSTQADERARHAVGAVRRG
jgi:hypothetical protein